MGRILALLLAVLLALSSPAVAVSTVDETPTRTADQSSVAAQDLENTTRMLSLPADESKRSAYVTPSPSLGPALDMHRDDLDRELDVNALERRIDAAGSKAEKRNALWQFSYRVEDRIETLRAEDQRAREAFVNESISADEYAQRLAIIGARAERLHEINDEMRSLGSDIPGVSFRTRYLSLQYELAVTDGPVRQKLGGVITGQDSSTRIHLAATQSGVVLSMLDKGNVVREATRTDNYGVASDTDGESDPPSRIGELYPYISDDENNNAQSRWRANVGITRFRFENTATFGEITLFFDSRTDHVFKEIREQRISFVETDGSFRNSTDGLNVTANTTYPGGPLNVNVTDADTGDPVRATISVDGEEVVTTSSDGDAWFVAPQDRFTLSASRNGETVNVTVTPRPLPRPQG